MLPKFAGHLYLAFLAAVLLVYYRLPRRGQVLLLVAAGGIFVARWDPRALGLMLLTAATDFVAGARIGAATTPARRRAWLAVSLTVNLGVLAGFKYLDFFRESLVALAGAAGWHLPWPALHILLPAGISFYTFRSLSYTLDVYRRQIPPTTSFADYAAFIAFFPILGAGPIVRARKFLPQFQRRHEFSSRDFDAGLSRFLLGLFKKTFVADTIAVELVNPVFARPGDFGAGAHWLALVGYAIQIYADFSGYSSMAIGAARMLGFRIPENFEFPYLAVNISEFWHRWHISLTSWFRDYLWWPMAKSLPFAGKLAARLRWSACLMVVFLASGLWHEAGWPFVVWGGLHGAYLVVYHFWRGSREAPAEPGSLGIVAGWALTQAAVLLAWVLFRSPDLAAAAGFLRALFVSSGTATLPLSPLVAVAFAGFLVDQAWGFAFERRRNLADVLPVPVRAVAFAAVAVFVYNAAPSVPNPFIYFRF